MSEHRICVTREALGKLQSLLENHRQGGLQQAGLEILEEELERAHIVSPEALPPDVITMNSEVLLRDLETGQTRSYKLVYPASVKQYPDAVSVMAPLGMALLGYRAGETIEWPVPKGMRRLKVLKILYQPEASARTSVSIAP